MSFARLQARTSDSFAAIDFETANPSRDSACAVAIVRVQGGSVVGRWRTLLRPPEGRFTLTAVHGITADDVRQAPSWAEAWPRVARLLAGVQFVAAHSAAFDRSVLAAACETAGVEVPTLAWVCTCSLARRQWPELGRFNLPSVCAHLRIPLVHHDPASDAEAAARIVLAAPGAAVGSS